MIHNPVTKQQTIPYLSEAALANLDISTDAVIDSIETLIMHSARNSTWSAPKAVIMPGDGRYMMAALAATDKPSLLTVKTVVLNPLNPEQGLPQINGLVTVLNSDTGLPVAILDGNWITAVRTAGLSAVAAKHMAIKDSSVVSFIGCGVQALSHLQAFADLFPLKTVKLFGRSQTNIDKLCRAAEQLSLSTQVCFSGEQAINDADLVVSSVTYSAQLKPFLNANCLKPGSFTAITDLSAPWHQTSFSAFDQLIIDDMNQEAALPNKLAPPGYVSGDLAGLVSGQFVGRNHPDDRNAFVFRGHALGDLALSVLAIQKAGLLN